jgi:hypothetical protein
MDKLLECAIASEKLLFDKHKAHTTINAEIKQAEL